MACTLWEAQLEDLMPWLLEHVDVLDSLSQRAQSQREAQQATMQRQHQAVTLAMPGMEREGSEGERVVAPQARQQEAEQEGEAAAAEAALQEAAAYTSWAALPDDSVAPAGRQSTGTEAPLRPASGECSKRLTDSGLGECAPPVATAISASATATKGGSKAYAAGRPALDNVGHAVTVSQGQYRFQAQSLVLLPCCAPLPPPHAPAPCRVPCPPTILLAVLQGRCTSCVERL